MIIPTRALSIVGLIAGLATSSHATLISPTSIIASTDADSTVAANTREVGNLLNGQDATHGEMQLKTGETDVNNWQNWEMNPDDRYGSGSAWSAAASSDQAQWVIVDLGAVYQLDTISIWNMNPGGTLDQEDRGAKTVNVYYTLDRSGDGNTSQSGSLFSNTGSVWTNYSMGTSVSKNDGDTIVGTPNAVLDDMGITAQYIAFDFTAAHAASKLDKVTVQEIQFFAVPEPSAYALIGGILALGSIMMRRRS